MQAYEPGRRRSDPLGNGEILGKTTLLNPRAQVRARSNCSDGQTVVANVSQRHGLAPPASSQSGPQPGPQSPSQSVPQSRLRRPHARERPGGDADGCLNEPQDSSVYSSAKALEAPEITSRVGAGRCERL